MTGYLPPALGTQKAFKGAMALVVGATVIGTTVVGAGVVGATVVGVTVVGCKVVGASVVGTTVVVSSAGGQMTPLPHIRVNGSKSVPPEQENSEPTIPMSKKQKMYCLQSVPTGYRPRGFDAQKPVSSSVAGDARCTI